MFHYIFIFVDYCALYNLDQTQLCVRGINVPIQGSEQSCICVLEVSMYQSREVSSHVFVC